MRKPRLFTLGALGVAATSLGWMIPVDDTPEKRPGPCLWTEVTRVGTRLTVHGEPLAGSGTSITFSTGLSLVEYHEVPEAEILRPRDRVRICVVSRPRDCPPGDRRGSIFRVTDPERGTTFEMPDAQHMCGGA